MAYKYITDVNAANFTRAADVPQVFGGYPRGVDFIGIHHWGNDGQDPWNVISYLASPNERQSSAHEVIWDGNVACLVHSDNASWAMANPTGYPNARGYHLELRPEATAGDYATAAERIADLRDLFGNVPLRPHRDFTQTACPGRWDLGRLDRLAADVAANRGKPKQPAAPVKPAPAPVKAAAQPRVWVVDPGDTLGQIAAYYGMSVETIAEANKLGDPDLISVGQRLTIPAGGLRSWTVDPGDTLGKIADYYGVTVDAICAVNGISDPNRITAGALLMLSLIHI